MRIFVLIVRTETHCFITAAIGQCAADIAAAAAEAIGPAAITVKPWSKS